MHSQSVGTKSPKDGKRSVNKSTVPKSPFTTAPISKPSPSTKYSCNDAVKADIFGNGAPQSTKYTAPKFKPKKKIEALTLKTRKRPTDADTTKKPTRLPKDVIGPTEKNDASVKRCPYCHEKLTWSDDSNSHPAAPILPPILQAAIDEMETADKEYNKARKDNYEIPRRRFVSNRDKYRFCQLHKLELKVKPAGIKSGFPIDVDFDGLKARVEILLPVLKQVVDGVLSSPYRDIALKAYKDQGTNKARSTTGVLTRFEKTIPGYYGPKGASIIMTTISDALLHTGYITGLKTKPQLPIEYIQQVLVPETGWRLIQDDMRKGQDYPDNKQAMKVMMASVDFGTMVYPSNDDDEGDTGNIDYTQDEQDDSDSDKQDTYGLDETLEYLSSDGEDNDN
ncbi:RTC4-like domain-containing protein [Chlamydoabsidia padenii]|nr:RTC4-like domain-containing protein [Chlamydoabsidia padenii]